MSAQDDLVTLFDIKNAQSFLKGKIVKTPIIPSLNIGKALDIQLNYKAEHFQKMGSFKIRGVLNKLNQLSATEKEKGVVTVSAGNHAKALAYASHLTKIKAVVVMPDYAPRNKIEAVKGFGAEVIQTTAEELLSTLEKTIEERDLTLVHPFDDLAIISGQGTVGLEILEQTQNPPDIVVVPVGGGGLISGISTAIKSINPEISVIGVEPKGANAMTQSLVKGEAVTLNEVNTIADGLAAPWAGKITLKHVRKYVDGMVIVNDDEIQLAMKRLILEDKIITEPAAAASLAAVLSGKIDLSPNLKITCVLSGSNVDIPLIKSLLV